MEKPRFLLSSRRSPSRRYERRADQAVRQHFRGKIQPRAVDQKQKWRVRRGLTQAELAEQADVELRFVQRVEQAKVNFGVVALVKLAQALEIAPAELLRPAELPRAKRGRPKAAKRPLAKSGGYGIVGEPKTVAVADRRATRASPRRSGPR
jgi:transcriptional regulator with XRE-family HTH domain